MGSAAQLDRAPRLEHAHDVAVLVAEEGDRPERFGLLLGGLEDPCRRVLQSLRVGQRLDLGDLFRGDRLVVREVEPQPIGSDHRAGLLHVLAEHLPQRMVEQVRARVVPPDRVTAFHVDRGRGRLPGRDDALGQASDVPPEVREGVRGVQHRGRTGLGHDGAGVADLPTGFGVERRPVEEQLDGVVRPVDDGEHRLSVDDAV